MQTDFFHYVNWLPNFDCITMLKNKYIQFILIIIFSVIYCVFQIKRVILVSPIYCIYVNSNHNKGELELWKRNYHFHHILAIGLMLFALFFGAGNLIFPGTAWTVCRNEYVACCSRLFDYGRRLPFLGILAIGFSGSRNLQDLASRIHPVYAVIFTSLLYLTIGPFFAAPRTGAVAFDVGISPFIGKNIHKLH